MRKNLLSIILSLFSVIAWSQSSSQSDFSISVNGNRIATKANFKQQVDLLRKNVNKQSDKTTYTLLQFTKIPTIQEQNELKNQGITLISYLSNNAYYVAVDPKFYSSTITSRNIRNFITFDSEYKIDPIIITGAIPDYAKDNNGIKVVVSYFKGATTSIINSNLKSLGLKNFKQIDSFNQVYLIASVEKLKEIAKLNWVQNIELIEQPVEGDNLPGVTSHKVNVLSSTIPGLGYDLTGNGVKIGIWDGNIEKHVDHTGRVTTREYESNSSHGQHVSGTVGGAGILDPRAKGMAPKVQIYGWNFNMQSNGLPVYVERDLAAKDDGVDLTSNSYGVLLSSGFNTTRYGVGDRGDDDVTVRNPSLLNVYSNGNAQAAYAGGFYTSTKASKNALHVAANDPNDNISSYSSFGPTVDGRLVPQIAAVGSSVYSLDYNNSYQVMSGTSMATPGTSGTLVLLYERYKNIFGAKPLASLMKALVSNTAKDVGNPGPDYKYGFGNLNALRAVKVLDKNMFFTSSVVNGASYEKDIVVPAGLTSLKVMLAYSDIGATPGVTNVLVNDLDIRIVKDGVTVFPWILDASLPNANATRGVDNLNNIEQITFDVPSAGIYKIIVTGSKVPLNAQDFAVVYDYVAPELVLTYPIGGEKFNPKSTEYIRWDYEGEDRTFNIEFSNDGGATYNVIAADVPSAARNFSWNVPEGIVPNAKIRISAGSRVDVSTNNFTIFAEPVNLTIASSACGGNSFKMDWDPIPSAKYEVLKLNGYQFDVVTVVTDPTYTFTNLTAGNNNWFTVRAIDIASGLVSERARAVNVEPISEAILTTLNLPFKEDFNNKKPTNYTLSQASRTGSIGYDYANTALYDAVKMSGSGTAGSPAWNPSTISNAFANNPKYIKRLSFCEIDASSLAGKAIRLKFNLIWKNSVAANKNFFRVLINGVAVASSENTTVYGGSAIEGNRELTYDLASIAGTKFNITFEGVMDNDATTASPPVYNTIFIDNVEFYEAVQNDLALTQLTSNVGLTATESVSVKVYNYSPIAINNIPVSYKINEETEVSEVIPGPIDPLKEVSYTFSQRANYSAGGFYKVAAKITPTSDSNASNNSLTKSVVNSGTDILIGNATVTTCSAVLTDTGSRYADYPISANQTTTFKPAIVGNSIKVDFSEFATEADYDFLYVYNGNSASSPILGKFNGNTLPPSLTSTAAGGELTFKFTSDAGVNDKGFIANISCVAKPSSSLNDVAIASIVSPDFLGNKTVATTVTIRVTNLGATTRTNIPVFYDVNGLNRISEFVPTINAGSTVSYTFTATADLSVADASYIITSGIDEVDDTISNNSLVKTVYNKNQLPSNTNTNGFAITKLKWNDVINTSGTSAYSDFKNIKIPVYAGFTYQPEVSIAKPERPITRDLTTTPGVFTMIVIDLNGDGNVTDEFYSGNFWVNTVNTATSPAIASIPSTHYFRNNFSLVGGVTIPSGTSAGEKLMRVIHMFRSPNEYFNVNLGPTVDNLTTSREDFEIEEYTINVLPFTAADASVERITAPVKIGMKPVTVSAVIRNFSTTAISNFPVAYKVNGANEVTQNFTGTIAAGATAMFSFTTKADLSAVDNYNLEVYTKLAGDTDATNDSKSVSFSHVADAITNVVGSFDGVDDYIATDAIPALELSNNYTFEAWVNRKSPTIFGRIFDKTRVNLFVHTNNNSTYKENSLVLSITTASGSHVINTGLNTVPLNKWQHIAFTVSASNVYTMYIDGVVAPYTATGTAGAATTNATLPAYIGGNPSLTRQLDGNIDEVRVWSGVKTQSEIAANAMTKYIGNEANLLAYYSFAEGDKQFVYDTTTSDNTAIVMNADTNGLGDGKFWNTPVLLQKLELKDQLSSSYDNASKTYTFLLNDSVDITTAIPEFTAGMNSIVKINGVTQTSGVTTNNFTNTVNMTIEGVGFNTGITETYILKVISGLSNQSKLLAFDFKKTLNSGLSQEINTTISGENASATVAYGINVSNLKANFTVSAGAELFIDDVKQLASTTTSIDYANSILVTVVSENKLSKTNYMVTVNAKNTEAKFLGYSVTNQFGTSIIDNTAKTVKVFVNNNAMLSAFIPSFTISDQAQARIGTYVQNSGVTSVNYVNPIQYNVLAQNGELTNWTIAIERAKPVISLLGDNIVTVGKGCTYTEAGYSAVDNLSVDLTAAVTVTGNVDTSTIGQYTLNYNVTDALNNVTVVTRTVNVTNDACNLNVSSNTINGFAMYPNPVNDGKVYVVTGSTDMKTIIFYDISGKQVLSVSTENKEVNTSKLSKGVYIVKVEQNGKVSTEKLIIE
ncbi:S8 family serine peptidase [Flavobacterium sp. PL12]|uniref:S8 family serine peptidase n=1 Tax=Flavobacterium sp. PL12 TaxID=3071718 RepID=UPI00319D9321